MPILYGVIILFLIYMIGLSVKRLWIMNFPWGENTTEDVSALDIPFFDDADEIIQRLENLGFDQLGVAKVELFWRRNKPSFVWYFVDTGKTTYAEVIEYKLKNHHAALGFSSWFPDNALIQTFFLTGENVDEANYSAYFVKEDLEGGYAHHQQVLQRLSAVHGTPVIFQNLAKLISWDAVYTHLYRRRHYHRSTIHLVLLNVVSLVSIFIMVSSIITELSPMTGKNEYEVIVELLVQTILILLCFIVMGVLFYSLTNPPGALDAGRKRKKTDGGLL